MTFGTQGSTYGGKPLAMAAGEAILDVVLDPAFLPQVRATGERLRQALEQMITNHDQLFESVRGMGLMLGIKLKSDSRAFVAHMRTHGLDRKSTRLNSSHSCATRMSSSAGKKKTEHITNNICIT